MEKLTEPISTFDRSKDNYPPPAPPNTWPEEFAKKLPTVQKYVPQLAIQIQRKSYRQKIKPELCKDLFCFVSFFNTTNNTHWLIKAMLVHQHSSGHIRLFSVGRWLLHQGRSILWWWQEGEHTRHQKYHSTGMYFSW